MDLENIIKNVQNQAIDKAIKMYSKAYNEYPKTTNYISTAIGVVGGDIIAKQFTDNPNVTLRDIVFTSIAAAGYSYLQPKMIKWSTKVTNKVSNSWKSLKDNVVKHTWVNSAIVTAMYLPVNMTYWNILTVKNESPITIEDNVAGLITLAIGTVPYLAADYIAIKKFSQPNTEKYLRPFYSAVEIAWNTLFAGGNYIAKKL
ncbi:MAG TPA: hypothetical protein VEC16_01820 [Alphaproteobacteria bacterium]|nr:hypothetical protein [Alphaproteobacteria bacterium]